MPWNFILLLIQLGYCVIICLKTLVIIWLRPKFPALCYHLSQAQGVTVFVRAKDGLFYSLSES